MKTVFVVFVVIGWYTGEDDYISGIFEKEVNALYAENERLTNYIEELENAVRK